MNETLETTITHSNHGQVEIWRYGIDDYAACFTDEGWSVRGTLLDILVEMYGEL